MAQERAEQSVPWGKITSWNVLFSALYFFRSVSLDIWLASRNAEVEFGELKFGETTLRTVREILRRVPLKADDTIFELGCGRGRAAFLLHFLTGAKVIGIDLVGSFINNGRRLARWMNCESHVQFVYENFLQTDLSSADAVYVCALCLNKETRARLAEKVRQCKPGTPLITVGWDPQREWLEPLDQFNAGFSWGSANVYLYKIRPCESTSIDSEPH